jgi:hypothetical protein
MEHRCYLQEAGWQGSLGICTSPNLGTLVEKWRKCWLLNVICHSKNINVATEVSCFTPRSCVTVYRWLHVLPHWDLCFSGSNKYHLLGGAERICCLKHMLEIQSTKWESIFNTISDPLILKCDKTQGSEFSHWRLPCFSVSRGNY